MTAPPISVIVPVYNDPQGVADTLDSLLDQTLPADAYEILVVDNGSTDGTRAVVQGYVARHPGRVQLHVEGEIRSSYAARNRGIQAARGAVLAFLDADVTVDPDYLEKVSAHIGDRDLDYLGCRIEVRARGKGLAEVFDVIHAFPAEQYFSMYRFVPTCCLTVRRSLIERAGPFDARLESGGDTEFSRRVERFGARKGFAHDVRIVHPARRTYRALVKKRLRLGRGAAQLHAIDPARFGVKRFSVREHLMPSNPLRILRVASQKGVPLGIGAALLLSGFKLPLGWAHLYSFMRESRRLNG